MNIIQVVLSLNCGGLEKLVIDFSKRLKEKGVNTSILCLANKGKLANKAEMEGIKVFSFEKKPGFDILLFLKLIKFLKKENVDILHTHNLAPLIYGSLAAKIANIKTINTRHGRANKKTFRLIWNINKYIVTVSQDAYRELLKNNQINSKKVKVIYNGIILSNFSCNFNNKFKSQIRNQLGLSENSLIIGIFARLAEEKDHKTLLKAFRLIIDKKINAELIIVGEGKLYQDLKKLTNDLKINNKVKFLGFRDDIPQLLSLINVFVLSSQMEGIPLTLLEAMAASKPIVATYVGGNPEVVLNGITGFLVPPVNAEKMAKRISEILIDQKLAKRMGEAGYRRVKELFNLEKMVDSYLQLYKDMIGKTC